MQFKNLAILAAAGVAVAGDLPVCVYPPLMSLQSGGNAVSRPDITHPVVQGEPFKVQWDSTGWGSDGVIIHLLKGPGANIALFDTLSWNAPNTGEFWWTPSCDCEVGTGTDGWGFMIQSLHDCTFQWSTQFGVQKGSSCPAPGSSTSTTSTGTASSTSTSSWGTVSTSSWGAPTWSSTWGPKPTSTWGGNGGYPGKQNCTSTSTVWVNPTPTPSKYNPIQGNSAATFGVSFAGVAAAFAAILF